MNVILIGFMGCGKSTIGVKLSYRMRQALLDTDKLVEKNAGCSIKEIFEREGEDSFRQKEHAVLEKLLEEGGKNYIIATGGGLPIQENNRPLLKKLGKVVYLRVTPETVYARLKHDKTRPLLQGDNPQEKINHLMAERQHAYEQAADYIVDVDGKSFEQILTDITEKVQ